jgi:hypothetical protein
MFNTFNEFINLDILATIGILITATTFVIQIIGSIFVKFAINRAGEIGQAKVEADPWASEGIPE